jgi:hypothetical protein
MTADLAHQPRLSRDDSRIHPRRRTLRERRELLHDMRRSWLCARKVDNAETQRKRRSRDQSRNRKNRGDSHRAPSRRLPRQDSQRTQTLRSERSTEIRNSSVRNGICLCKSMQEWISHFASVIVNSPEENVVASSATASRLRARWSRIR